MCFDLQHMNVTDDKMLKLGVPVATAMQDPNFRSGFMHVPVEVVDAEQHSRPATRPRRQRY